jgi:hypothetical protein
MILVTYISIIICFTLHCSNTNYFKENNIISSDTIMGEIIYVDSLISFEDSLSLKIKMSNPNNKIALNSILFTLINVKAHDWGYQTMFPFFSFKRIKNTIYYINKNDSSVITIKALFTNETYKYKENYENTYLAEIAYIHPNDTKKIDFKCINKLKITISKFKIHFMIMDNF